MFKQERHQKIIEILNEKTYISVNKLSNLLYVSLPTIRRDLSELEKKGMIVRNHGGAMSLTPGKQQIPLNFRSSYKTSEKHAMCKKAAKLISDGDIIYIDISSSTSYIPEYITAKNVTVVTNGLPVAMQLMKQNIKTYFLGGELSPNSLGTSGKFAETEASQFNFDLAFFSTYGINNQGMIVDTYFSETMLKKEIFKNCKKKVFLYDTAKKNLDAPYNVVPLDQIEVLITP